MEHRIAAEIAAGVTRRSCPSSRRSRPATAPRPDVGEPDARPLPLGPASRGVVDVRARPRGPVDRARDGSFGAAAAAPRADPPTRPGARHPESGPGSVRPSRIDLPPGTEFASYRIERTLGRGGMSVVYLAEHEWLQRKVALKVLARSSPRTTASASLHPRVEARPSLDHPNVIPIYEAGVRRRPVHRDALRGGEQPADAAARGRRARAGTRDRDRPPGGGRARRRTRAGARPPRREARQRPRRGRGARTTRSTSTCRTSASRSARRATPASPGPASSSGRWTTLRPSSSRAASPTRAPTCTRSGASCSNA